MRINELKRLIYDNIEAFLTTKGTEDEIKAWVYPRLSKCKDISHVLELINDSLEKYPVLYKPLVSINLKPFLIK